MSDVVGWVVGLLWTAVEGLVPERQPWRAIVTGLYLLGALIGLTVLVVLIVRVL